MTQPSFDTRKLDRLFRPKSIAVVGASDDPGRIGGRPIRILKTGGFPGDIYPVNPKYSSVFGIRCYPDIAALPNDIDLYIFCIQAEATVETFEIAANRGAKAAVIFGGGFAEIGGDGRRRQERLRALAESHNIPVCGPNTLGFASFANATFGTFATALEAMEGTNPGNIALLSQSGGTAFNLYVEARSAGARFSHVVATGNEVTVGFPEYLSYFAQDDRTRAVVGYMEGVGDGGRLAEALQMAQEVEMPVFLLKAGVTKRGALAAQSHTAQISGNDTAFNALFSRYGVTRLTTFSDVVDVCRAIELPPIDQGIAIATNSGGAAVYLSDLCDRYDVPLAQLSKATTAELSGKLPAFAGLRNPVDFTAQVLNDPGLLATTIDVLDRDQAVEAIVVFLGSMQSLADSLINTIRTAREKCRKPLVLTWMGVSNAVRVRAEAAGLVVSDDPARVLNGLGRARQNILKHSAIREMAEPASQSVSDDSLSEPPIRYMDEHTLKQCLREQGIATPRGELVADLDQALSATQRVGYPCVVKVTLPVVPHKIKEGAIQLNIRTATQLRSAFDALLESAPSAVGFLIEAQVPPAPEVIVGLIEDPTFGTRAVMGLGGVALGDGSDVVTLVPPFTVAYMREQIQRLGLDQALQGQGIAAGTAAAELRQLLEVLERVLLQPGSDLLEIECNPVVFHDGKLVVLDALAIRASTGAGGSTS